jgi:hypothetical protein
MYAILFNRKTGELLSLSTNNDEVSAAVSVPNIGVYISNSNIFDIYQIYLRDDFIFDVKLNKYDLLIKEVVQ